jgi:hypothetical protein
MYLDLLGGAGTLLPTCVKCSPGIAAAGGDIISTKQLRFEQLHAEIRGLLNEWRSIRMGIAREAAASTVQMDAHARIGVPSPRLATGNVSARVPRLEALPPLASLGVDTEHPAMPDSPRHLHRTAVERVRLRLETLRADAGLKEERLARVAVTCGHRREEVFGNHITRNALEVW